MDKKSNQCSRRLREFNPDKVGRGHAFGKVGRSSKFKSKKEYRRKDKKNTKPANDN